MAIIWRDSMTVGNVHIDQDHRYLICLINTIELALQTPEEKEIITGALMQLEQYTTEHFDREEEIQKKISYPNQYDHLKKHRELVTQFKNIKGQIEKSLETTKKIEDPQVIIKFLRHWLIDHVIQEDLQMSSLLKQYPADMV